jgi:hypothetical protein
VQQKLSAVAFAKTAATMTISRSIDEDTITLLFSDGAGIVLAGYFSFFAHA